MQPRVFPRLHGTSLLDFLSAKSMKIEVFLARFKVALKYKSGNFARAPGSECRLHTVTYGWGAGAFLPAGLSSDAPTLGWTSPIPAAAVWTLQLPVLCTQ